MATKEPQAVLVDRVKVGMLRVPIEGTAPLIVHNFSDKSKREMLERQQGKGKQKTLRDPEAEYQAAFYRLAGAKKGQDGYGFPVLAFKAATIGAARFYGKDVTMTMLRQCLFFKGIMTSADPQQLIPIEGEPEMREDVVRLGGAGSPADLRYRPQFWPWKATLDIHFIASALAEETVLSLVEAGGLGVGVGEWRPEKRGEFGTFRIDATRKLERAG